MRIAIVHDALCVSGGAERLVLWMAKAFPQAPIFTSVYLPQNTFAEFKSLDVRTLPFAGAIKTERQFKLLFPLWLLLMQTSNYADFDVVLSSSTYLAKYIRPAPAVKHVCYLYAPFRLLWKPADARRRHWFGAARHPIAAALGCEAHQGNSPARDIVPQHGG